MRILHYFLGFPPYRSGGLTRYAYSLMTSQSKRGDVVFGLWPGRMNGLSYTRIIRHKDIQEVQNYEIVNPLPVPLDEGIKDPQEFMKTGSKEVWITFLKNKNIDIIHVHTLMGLYKEFLEAANELHIRLIFTTHDYFGLCPKVILYHDDQVCQCHHDYHDCIQCNETALSITKIKLLQSPLYRCIKDTSLIKILRQKHRKSFFSEETQNLKQSQKDTDKLCLAYALLEQYYVSMLLKFDLIHFNSELAKSIYMQYVTPNNWQVLSITHQDISDHRDLKNIPSDMLRFTCLAPAKSFKGFKVIKHVFDHLWSVGRRDFILNLFGQVDESSPYMNIEKVGFTQAQLPQIMQHTDVVLAPSVWYETFGFTVLEALSYGVPVIVSHHVGAKDIIGQAGIIVEAGSEESFYDAIEGLTKEKIQYLKDKVKEVDIKTWDIFLKQNDQLYKGEEEIS